MSMNERIADKRYLIVGKKPRAKDIGRIFQ